MGARRTALVAEEDVEVGPGVVAPTETLVEGAGRIPPSERDGAWLEFEEILGRFLRNVRDDAKFGAHVRSQALGAMSVSDSGGPQVAAG